MMRRSFPGRLLAALGIGSVMTGAAHADPPVRKVVLVGLSAGNA